MKHHADQMTLFEGQSFHPANEGKPWKIRHTAYLLNTYLKGATPFSIARKMKRSPKSIERQIERFKYNEKGRCDKYEPFERESRRNERPTQNEQLMDTCMKAKGVSDEVRAKVLQRDVKELGTLQKQPPSR